MGQPRVINDRYELGDVLGHGGMGIVYRALDRFVRREVAVKTVHDICDANTLELFYKEWGVLASLVHPNVVEIYDVGEYVDEGVRKPYFVMPLLPGKTLTTVFKEGGVLSVERTVDIVCNTCRGLQAAHEKGLIHRDIKPSNIFVMADDSVKVIDFGVAHLVDTHSTTLAKGTPAYMAPEQIRMERPSRETDIFSLGVVCYEVLSGQRPFRGGNENDLLESLLHRYPEPLSEINPAVNQALSRVIHKAMAKQRAHRFPTAREFADALQRASLNQPLEFLDPAHYQPRIERASKAFEQGEYEVASEILGELESEGHVDPQIRLLRDRLNRAVHRKERRELFGKARLYLGEEEYGLALRKIQDALRFDPEDSEALQLKSEIELQRDKKKTNRFIDQARRHLAGSEFQQARQILQKALAIHPDDDTVRQLAAEVDREERQQIEARDEKGRLRVAAMELWRQGALEAAVGLLDRLLLLEEKHPSTDPGSAAADRKFHQQIRGELEEIETALDQAQAHLESEKFNEALALCNRCMRKYPDQPRLLALRDRIEERERERKGELVQEARQRALAEPDLDVRMILLDQARQQFPGEQTLLRFSQNERERRERVSALIARARQYEQRGDLEQAIEQWEQVRSHHPQHPDLNRQVEYLAELRAERLRVKRKTEWVQQIRQQLEAQDYRAAVEIARRAVERFPGDADLENLASEARQGRQRAELMEQLLADSRAALAEGRLQDATAKLRLAHDLARQGFGPPRAAVEVLLEAARQASFEDKWGLAAELTREALALGPGDREVLELNERIAEKERESYALERAMRAQDLLDRRDFAAALSEAELGLERQAGDDRLRRIANQARGELGKIEQRERLLSEGRRLVRERSWDRAANSLAQACAIDPADRKTRAAVVVELIEQARTALDTDWQGAKTLLEAALRLDPAAEGVAELQSRIAQLERAANVAARAARIRELDKAGQLREALTAAESAVSSFPAEKALAKLHDSLRKRLSDAERRDGDLDELRRLLERCETVSDVSETDTLATKVTEIAGRWPADETIQRTASEARQRLDRAVVRLKAEEERQRDRSELERLLARCRTVASDAEADELARKTQDIGNRHAGDETIGALVEEAQHSLAEAVRKLRQQEERERDLHAVTALLSQTRHVESAGNADSLAGKIREIAGRHREDEQIGALAQEAEQNLAAAARRWKQEQERQQDLEELKQLVQRSLGASPSESGELAARATAIARRHPQDQTVQALANETKENLSRANQKRQQERERQESMGELTRLLPRSRKVSSEADADELATKVRSIAERYPEDQQVREMAEQAQQNLATVILNLKAAQQPPAPASPAPPDLSAEPFRGASAGQPVSEAYEPWLAAASPTTSPPPEVAREPVELPERRATGAPSRLAPLPQEETRPAAARAESAAAPRGWVWGVAALLAVALGATAWMMLIRSPEPEPVAENQPPVADQPIPQDAASAERDAFELARTANSLEAYQQYLLKYPGGTHQAEALEAIQLLQEKLAETNASQPPAGTVAESKTQIVPARLSVVTIPPEAEVVVIAGERTVTRRSSPAGMLDVEIAAGDFRVEVRAPNHETYQSSGSLSSGGRQTIVAALKPRPGSIILSGNLETRPRILLDGRAVDGNVTFTSGRIEISEVPAGTRMVRLEQPGYDPWQSDVTVPGGSAVTLPVTLNGVAPQVAALTVQTVPGATVFLEGIRKGEASAQGTLRIPDVSPGPHEVRVNKEKYSDATRSVTLPEGGEANLRIDLERLFSGAFSDRFFDLTNWTAPRTWSANSGKLQVAGSGIGWLKDREYQNFDLTFSVLLTNGKGAVWALRAESDQNYYLFQLRGPKASPPNTIAVYLYRQGQALAKHEQKVPIDLRQDDWLTVTVNADSTRIVHMIQSSTNPTSATGEVLYILTPDRFSQSYSYGGVGFGTRDGEEFQISELSIVTPGDKTR